MQIKDAISPVTRTSNQSVPSMHRDELRSSIQSIICEEVTRVETGQPIAVSQLRTKLRAICADAKRRDSRAESLLILIKDVWNVTPEARALRLESGVPSLLSQIVTTAIDEFYGFAIRLEDLVPKEAYDAELIVTASERSDLLR